MPESKRTASSSPPVHVFLSIGKKYLLFAARRWWMLVPLIAIGVGVAYWKSSQKAPVYTSTARMMVSARIALPEGAVYSEELANFYGTQIELLQSSEIQRRAAARVQATRPELRASPVSIAAGQQRGTSFFYLIATGPEPQYCQAYLDAVMSEYVQFKREMRSDSADTAVTSVTDQLLKLDKELQAGEEELIAFQKRDNVVFLEEEGNSAGRYLISLRQKLADLETEYELLNLLDVDQNIERRARQGANADQKSATPAAEAVEGMTRSEADYLAAKQRIQILQASIDRLGKVLRPKHPKMVQMADQIEQQNKLIELYRQQSAAQIQTRRSTIGLQVQNLKNEIKEWETKALDLNLRIADYNRIKSKVDRSKSLSERLLATVQSVDMNKSLGQDVLTIMERASLPTVTNPDLIKDLITGGVAGLVLGFGILCVFALFDDRVASVLEIQHAFEEEVVAQIPREPDPIPLDLGTMEEHHPMFSEACKNLRSSLVFMTYSDHRPKTFLVTSSIPGEGKSTISANLATTLASAGSRTLLIDGDLRKGRLHDFFGRQATPGLTEVLRRAIDVKEAIISTPFDNLSFLSRGRVAMDASELYLRNVTDDFLRQVYQDYDYIVIDSAPVLAKEDTASLAPKIDATLFVIRAGVASLRRSRTALEILKKRSVNILGIVFNSAEKSSPGYYYYQSYGPQGEVQTK